MNAKVIIGSPPNAIGRRALSPPVRHHQVDEQACKWERQP